jgi:hypothetical protein
METAVNNDFNVKALWKSMICVFFIFKKVLLFEFNIVILRYVNIKDNGSN